MLELQRETDASVASQKETVTTRIYIKYLSTFLMFIKTYIYIGSSKERDKQKMMRQKSQNSKWSVARPKLYSPNIKKSTVNICALLFSQWPLQSLSRKYLTREARGGRSSISNRNVQWPIFLSDYNKNSSVLTNFNKTNQRQILYKISFACLWLLHAEI